MHDLQLNSAAETKEPPVTQDHGLDKACTRGLSSYTASVAGGAYHNNAPCQMRDMGEIGKQIISTTRILTHRAQF